MGKRIGAINLKTEKEPLGINQSRTMELRIAILPTAQIAKELLLCLQAAQKVKMDKVKRGDETMRKALCVGIDCYEKISDLHGCVNDANAVKEVLQRNGDGTLNFDVKLLTATSETSYISRSTLKDSVEELFRGDSEIALFYFSGHGSIDELGGYLCTSEISRPDEVLSLSDLMGLASQSKARNTIIILDSCFCGSVSGRKDMPGYSAIHEGTTILAACSEHEYASEENNHGVFTSLMVEALYGGAMNIIGDVTPGGVYSYIDQSLGAWEQRPVFKANIKEFVSLRKNTPQISIFDLRKITTLFSSPTTEIHLDPTYEPDKHEADTTEVNKEHEADFALLQKYVKLNLVVPVGEEHMYYAAIHRKTCKLTVQGQHYWRLISKNQI